MSYSSILTICLLSPFWQQLPEQNGAKLQQASFPTDTNFGIENEAGTFRSVDIGEFRVSGRINDDELRKIGQAARQMKAELKEYWFADRQLPNWDIQCLLIVHQTRGEYLAAIGRAGIQTMGTTSIQLQAGRVILRRIDLLQAETGEVPGALRHELMHVLLADIFPRKAPPRWAEEGLALMNDTREKQQAHRAELQQAGFTVNASTASDVMLSTKYPEMEQRGAFYAKSLVVVETLIAAKTPAEFIRFMEKSCESGAEVALQEVYGIQNVQELQGRYEASLSKVRQANIR